MERHYFHCRPPRVHSAASLQRVLAEEVRNTPRGEWIMGRGWHTLDEKRWPNRWDLDPVSPHNPVMLLHWGGQFAIANTQALRKAGLLRRDVKDPYGGKYHRHPKTGDLTGILIHYPAIYSVHKLSLSESQERDCVLYGTKKFLEMGVTCVHDNFGLRKDVIHYMQLDRAGELPLRMRVYPYVWNKRHLEMLLPRLRRVIDGKMCRLQGIKMAVDGYPLMYDKHKGKLHFPMHPQPVLEQMVKMVHDAGFQADLHAVGDKAVDWGIGAFKKAGGASGIREFRHRLEHVVFCRQQTVEEMAKLGIPFCTQPYFTQMEGDRYFEIFGQKTREMLPLASMARASVVIGFGADVPAFPTHNPVDSLDMAVNRRTRKGVSLGADESVSLMKALEMHTKGSAYLAFDEKEIGTLEKGKLADIAVWNQDPAKVKPKNIRNLKAIAAYLGGKEAYRHSSYTPKKEV